MSQDSEIGIRARAVMPYLSQPEKGYRYSTDAVVLSAFVAQKHTHSWVDLGTGCGIIAFRLAQVWSNSSGLAIDRVADVVNHARLNLQRESVSVVLGDVRHFPFGEESMDLAVCNPPFFDANAFRPNRDPSIKVARHALHGDIVTFANLIKKSLKVGGRFCFVFPMELVADKHSAIVEMGYFLQRRLIVQSFWDRPGHGVCLEYGLEKKPVVEEKLTLYQKPGFYTQKAWDFLNFGKSSC